MKASDAFVVLCDEPGSDQDASHGNRDANAAVNVTVLGAVLSPTLQGTESSLWLFSGLCSRRCFEFPCAVSGCQSGL